MQKEQQIQEDWINALIQLIKMGEANGYLSEEKEFDVCLSSETEKISIFFKLEPTNIIGFAPKTQKRV